MACFGFFKQMAELSSLRSKTGLPGGRNSLLHGVHHPTYPGKGNRRLQLSDLFQWPLPVLANSRNKHPAQLVTPSTLLCPRVEQTSLTARIKFGKVQ